MAKAPEPGRAKTRLADRLGASRSAQLSAALIREVAGALCRRPAHWDIALCVDQLSHPLFVELAGDGHRSLYPQEGGNLGERMARIVSRLLGEYARVIVVGSDCIEYDAAYLGAATVALENGAQAVLGPAVDGGYVLIGMSRFDPALFESVPWGGSEVTRVQRERFAALGYAWEELPVRADVDVGEDLDRLRHSGWLARAGFTHW